MASLPDEDQSRDVRGSQNGDRFHVLASWRQDDGGVYVYARGPVGRGGGELGARADADPSPTRGEPDVVSVMTYEEWERAILDVRRSIGD